MSNHREIAEALGQAKMATALKVGPTAVNNAVKRGKFPASWYLVIKSLCDGRGIECPQGLFSIKQVHNSPDVDAADTCQDRGAA